MSIEDKLEEANRTVIIRGVEPPKDSYHWGPEQQAALQAAVEQHLAQIGTQQQENSDMPVDQPEDEGGSTPAAAPAEEPAKTPQVTALQQITQRNKTSFFRCTLKTIEAAELLALLAAHHLARPVGAGPAREHDHAPALARVQGLHHGERHGQRWQRSRVVW